MTSKDDVTNLPIQIQLHHISFNNFEYSLAVRSATAVLKVASNLGSIYFCYFPLKYADIIE